MAGITHEAPTEVEAEDGHVIVEADGGLGLTMTPEAANETADRLKATAFRAARQRNRLGGEDL